MKAVITIIIISVSLVSCELFVIGTKKKPSIEVSQNSPVGSVLLFKAKIDSNKLQDASHLMRKQDGSEFIAIEKHDLLDDLERFRRIVGDKPVTEHYSDTINQDNIAVSIIFDYIKKYRFETKRITDLWYITGFKKY